MKNSFTEPNVPETLPPPRTDLACERTPEEAGAPGTSLRRYEKFGIEIEEWRVETEEGARRTGRRMGRYTTLCCPPLRYLSPEQETRICTLLSALLRDYLRSSVGRQPGPQMRVLVAGLGNREITPDAIGPKAAERIRATAHMAGNPMLTQLGCCEVCAIHPGVTGQTGMEAAHVLHALAKQLCPDAVIAVDALAARSVKRLCATVQVTDTGIAPGSGAGLRRGAVDREHIGVPVIAVGVPTVVDCATLVYDTLAGVCSVGEELQETLSEQERFFVSPRDMDVIAAEIATLLARSINQALGTELP